MLNLTKVINNESNVYKSNRSGFRGCWKQRFQQFILCYTSRGRQLISSDVISHLLSTALPEKYWDAPIHPLHLSVHTKVIYRGPSQDSDLDHILRREYFLLFAPMSFSGCSASSGRHWIYGVSEGPIALLVA